MLVRFVKQIKPEDFVRITAALTKMEEISSILTQAFLFASLKLGTALVKNKDEGTIFARRGIGPFVNTKYAIAEVAAGVACDREYPDETDRPRKFATFVGLDWVRDQLDAINDIYFTVDGNQEGTEVFTMGDFVRRCSRDNQIFNLASFFYRRRTLYENTYKVLLANKNRLEKITNSVFADNFITLFSVKAKLEKVENFPIPKANFKVEVSADSNNPYQENLSEIKNISYCLHPVNLSIQNVKLSFDKPDFLTLEFTLSDYFRDEALRTWTEENIKNTAGQPIFNKFIDQHLNNWLKNLVLLSIFQTKIYEKVKTKLLITQI
jgi:hypothetical protein